MDMSPPQRPRHGCEASRKWRSAAPPAPSMNRTGLAPQPWPLQPSRHNPKTMCGPPHVSHFHTRHAEESAERPHLVTVVRPCGQSSLRKVTILLNRRGVVSLEQLLLDISEALGFPRWHRSRVTRLFTTYAREVKSVCDFFRGDVAFLAFGKTRPEPDDVAEALEELFPDHLQYRADVLTVWEKKLRGAQNKASKADSGYSEGTDGEDGSKRQYSPSIIIPSSDFEDRINSQKTLNNKLNKNSYRYLPNHLQRLRVRGGVREQKVPADGPSKHGSDPRDAESPTLCRNCVARKVKRVPEPANPLSGWTPLPPVVRKQKGSSSSEQEVRKQETGTSRSPPRSNETVNPHLLPTLDPLPAVGGACKNIPERSKVDLLTGDHEVTQSDVESLYVFGRVVGDGNFAVVQECRRRDDGRTFALKAVERYKLVGREHMMQNELSLLGSLSHPRVVRLFAHHRTATHSYLVMELVSGGDLFEAISARGTFTEAEVGLMVSDVSEALDYIHRKSIVHRDIKPENLLIENSGVGVSRLKLADFGLAMVVTEPVFTICGTPTYVAPEILSETGYGVEVDVWALGVILYILLCGFPPFRSRDRNQEELFQMIKQAQVHFFPPYWDPISEEAKDLVKELLQPDPTVRTTAGRIVLHPWVKNMASLCMKRALTHNTETPRGVTVKDCQGSQSHPEPEEASGQNEKEDDPSPPQERRTLDDSENRVDVHDDVDVEALSSERSTSSLTVVSSPVSEKQTPNSLLTNPSINRELSAVKGQKQDLKETLEAGHE